MAKTLSDHLLNTLEELVPYDFEKFKFKLQNTSLEKEHCRIPRGHLQMARPVKLATLLINYYGEEYAVRLTLHTLRAINQRLLAEELHKATGSEHSTQEKETDISTGSPRETKPRNGKVPDASEGDGQGQSSDGSANLPASQPEVGKGPQKKPPGRRRDQKGAEALDAQSKLWARGSAPLSRSPIQSPGAKERKASAQLRRNASSAGRLQGLCSGSLGRREGKKSEAYLPSGKKRPKSLEITIPPGDEDPPNPEALQTQEKARLGKLGTGAPARGGAPPDGGAPVALEKGSGFLVGETLRNTLPSASLSGEGKCTTPREEDGVRGPEISETSGKTAGSVPHEFPNPEGLFLLPYGKQTGHLEDPASLGLMASKGRPQDEAVCAVCHRQQGDLRSGALEHVAPGDPKALGRCSSSCPQFQALLARKSSEHLGPQPLPQCPRHKNQVQLLFCEDHGGLICLICRLSQEHRGHWVRPVEEAALKYREQTQKELEHLKELRRCGEEHRRQGDKKTENFLKQTETQKQRVRSQLEKLYQFLEQQEKIFVSWLEELGQTIGQVQETYDTRVSRDITLINELIGELEAKQGQPEWEFMQDIGSTLHRAKMVTVPEPWVTPPEVKEKIHLLYQKSEFVEKSMQRFSETLRSVMEVFNVTELTGAQAHAVNVLLDSATAHPNLIFSDDMKSVRLGNKWERLPDSPGRFNSCIMTLGSPTFASGCHYWEVEVGDKTAWVLGACSTSASRQGSITLSPENGYWVVVMMKQNEYQASTFPPTRLQMMEPPKRVGIFLDYIARVISFYNVTARSHIYTFNSFSSSGPLQPIFSPGAHDGGKNVAPLIICPVGGQRLDPLGMMHWKPQRPTQIFLQTDSLLPVAPRPGWSPCGVLEANYISQDAPAFHRRLRGGASHGVRSRPACYFAGQPRGTAATNLTVPRARKPHRLASSLACGSRNALAPCGETRLPRRK
uniref:pyrin n=1 Tax=Jaculus jaculus TaxID=51337 RepID=UPI001E1B5F72|nr:pyrin [Jaculus jaculus]